jgi:hypothetical protein
LAGAAEPTVDGVAGEFNIRVEDMSKCMRRELDG